MILLINLILISFICYVPVFQGVSSNNKTDSPMTDESGSVILISTEGIDIENDTDFNTYGFSGDGSIANPYIIENYVINTTSLSGITISQTTKYFIIQNCTIQSEQIGISIYYIASGTGQIIGNKIMNVPKDGIHVDNADNLKIINNIIQKSVDDAIFVGSSVNVSIIGNQLFENNGSALNVLFCQNVLVKDNNLHDNNRMGVVFVGDVKSNIDDNLIENNGIGISLDNTSLTVVYNNSVGYSEVNNMYLSNQSSLNIIYYNKFYNSTLSEARDDGNQNFFFNSTSKKGNYWSDWTTGEYTIPGSANNVDLFPLTKDMKNNEIIKTTTILTTTTVTADFSTLGILIAFTSVITIRLKKEKKN